MGSGRGPWRARGKGKWWGMAILVRIYRGRTMHCAMGVG